MPGTIKNFYCVECVMEIDKSKAPKLINFKDFIQNHVNVLKKRVAEEQEDITEIEKLGGILNQEEEMKGSFKAILE